jgi:hypothetical protein
MGSLGLSTYTIRNLERFYSLIYTFEHSVKTDIRLDAIDHKLVGRFKKWLLAFLASLTGCFFIKWHIPKLILQLNKRKK